MMNNEKENFIQKRKLTNATDPELKFCASVNRAPENSPNRKVGTVFFFFFWSALFLSLSTLYPSFDVMEDGEERIEMILYNYEQVETYWLSINQPTDLYII